MKRENLIKQEHGTTVYMVDYDNQISIGHLRRKHIGNQLEMDTISFDDSEIKISQANGDQLQRMFFSKNDALKMIDIIDPELTSHEIICPACRKNHCYTMKEETVKIKCVHCRANMTINGKTKIISMDFDFNGIAW